MSLKLAAAIAAIAGVGALVIFWRGHRAAKTQKAIHQQSKLMPTLTSDGVFNELTAIPVVVPVGYLPVLSVAALSKHCDVSGLIEEIRSASKANQDTFAQNYAPVIDHMMELVQLLPASESHHHANPGGMLTHSLETAGYALKRRQACWLPPNQSSERQAAMGHRWTYAVFIAAIIHEVGKPFSDLKITAIKPNQSTWAWNPLSGTLSANSATGYRVDFPTSEERNYAAHTRLPMLLFTAFVPRAGIQWMSEDADLLPALEAYLNGSDKKSVLATLVIGADSESVRRNLLLGSRERFATARAKPLIEQLMDGLHLLLEQGTLPLNRSGAAGWIYDDKIWLVSKRIADEVRAVLTDAKGIPGPDKNDRFFDTWQEYGALVPNPKSGGAVWTVTVAGVGYQHDLTCLCFKLDSVYKANVARPTAMQGEIRVAGQTQGRNNAIEAQDVATDNQINNGALSEPETQNAVATTNTTVEAKEAAAIAARSDDFASNQSTPLAPSVPAILKPSPPASQNQQNNNQNVVPIRPIALAKPASHPDDKNYLNHEDSALAAVQEDRAATLPAAAVLKPITVAVQLPVIAASSNLSEPVARFLNWLQVGLANGEILHNDSGAHVHFVDDGMLLVSPSIFKNFASKFGEAGDGVMGAASDDPKDALGNGIQRAVLKANLHVKTKSNITSYNVISRGVAKAKLNGVLIRDPIQFVNPLPASNPYLVRIVEANANAVPTMGKGSRK